MGIFPLLYAFIKNRMRKSAGGAEAYFMEAEESYSLNRKKIPIC